MSASAGGADTTANANGFVHPGSLNHNNVLPFNISNIPKPPGIYHEDMRKADGARVMGLEGWRSWYSPSDAAPTSWRRSPAWKIKRRWSFAL